MNLSAGLFCQLTGVKYSGEAQLLIFIFVFLVMLLLLAGLYNYHVMDFFFL